VISVSGSYRSVLIMRAFLLVRSNSLIIPRPCSHFGDRDDTSNTSELLGQQDYEALTYAAPPEPHLDRCTLKVR
jgi:hypothetical protein